MNKLFAAFVLFATCSAAQAATPSFLDTLYTTSAFASVGAAADRPRGSATPAPLPLLSSAALSRPGGSGSASAIADQLFLSTTAEADSLDADASSTAVSTFSGTLTGTGLPLLLSINFDSQTAGIPGAANNLLALSIVANGVTLLDETFSGTAKIVRRLTLDSPALLQFDLSLASDAFAFGGTALGLSSASFSIAAVPEPDTWMLMGAGLGGLLLVRVLRERRTLADGAPYA